jgi:cell division protein FtsZ
VERASFFAANTDLKALDNLSRKVEKFQFGQNLTRGLGTGMNPEIGENSAKSEKERIKKTLEGQDLVILIASLGGGVGSGAGPVFAKISKDLGNLTYGIFTLPFKFEGTKKMEIAKDSLRKLRGKLNAFTLLPNEKIFQIINRTTSFRKSLSTINKSLADSLQGLIEIIYKPGLINIDFADLRTIFEGQGRLTYLNSIEIEKGEEKEVMEKVVHSPLYPYSIGGAKGVLFNISGGRRLSLAQVSQISKTISERANKEAKIIFGISSVPKDSRIKVTLLATGCSKPRSEIFRLKSKKNFSKKPKPKKKEKIVVPKKEKKVSPQPKVSPPRTKSKKKAKKINREKPKLETKKESATVVRKNALTIKKEAEEEEAEILAKEEFWETPAFLKKKLIKGQ